MIADNRLRQPGHERPGFTLVELMVVVGVIAVLAALVFPTFAGARAKGRQASCLSNIRQLGQATALYLADYDETYPHAIHGLFRDHPDPLPGMPDIASDVLHIPLIQDVLQPYTRSYELFHCPSDFGAASPLSTPVRPSWYAVYGSSYMFVPLLMDERITCWQRTAELAYADDGSGEWHTWFGASYWDLRANVLFYDGHAKFLFKRNIDYGISCGQE